jgi:hypothetical protein
MRKLKLLIATSLVATCLAPARAQEPELLEPLRLAFDGGISTYASLPFAPEHTYAVAADGLAVSAVPQGSGVRLTITDQGGLSEEPRLLTVLAVGEGRAARLPVIVSREDDPAEGDSGAVGIASAASYGFSPPARALSLNINTSGLVTFTLTLPPGPFVVLASSSASYNVSVTPASGTSTGAPVVVSATVTALGGASHVIAVSALGNQAYQAYIALMVNNPALTLQLTPSAAKMGILSAPRTLTLALANPSGAPKFVQLTWMRSPLWPVSGMITQALIPAIGSITIPLVITRNAALGNRMDMVVHAVSADGDVQTGNYTIEVVRSYFPRVTYAGPNTPDSYEPDNTCAQHSTIQFGPSNQQSRTHHGPPEDIDVVKYVIPPNATHVVQVRGLGYNAEPILRAYYDTCTTSFSGGYGVITSTNNLTAALALPNPYSLSRDIWLVIKNNKPSGPGTEYILRVVP